MTCNHLFTTYYRRPWRHWWRKQIVLGCWRCGEFWPEP